MTSAFQVDLRGIVDLLSHHLYSGPEVFVRELLQNAVDALTAAGVREPIVFEVDQVATGRPVISVHDDGIGLTADEVRAFLSTIGSSSKRDELFVPRSDFLGRFGIGLLSCFMVADEITVLTLSRRGGPGVRWQGRADGSYVIQELRSGEGRSLPGTSVSLAIRPGLDHVSSGERVLALVRRYGGLLGQSVVVRSEGQEHTFAGRPLPWSVASDRTQLLEVGREVLGEDFLDAIPLSLPAAGVTGVAYVLGASPSPQSRQRHTVYLKRMLLADNVDRLTPDWAFFVRVVIDTDSLRPVASREGLYEDETLAIVREAIGFEIRNWLVHIADHEPDRLQALVRVHALALKALAVHDDQLLGLFARWIPVETAMGRMTLTEAAARSPRLRYAETLDTFRQLAQVAAAEGVLLVNGGYTYDAEILSRLPMVLPGVHSEVIEAADLLDQLDEVDAADQVQAIALATRGSQLLKALDCEVTVRVFSPTSLPCLYLAGEAARFERAALEVADLAGGFWGSVVSGLAGSGSGAAVQLCLNFRHPVVRALVHRTDPALRTALEVLYLQALLLGRHPLRGREISLLSKSLVRLLETDVPS